MTTSRWRREDGAAAGVAGAAGHAAAWLDCRPQEGPTTRLAQSIVSGSCKASYFRPPDLRRRNVDGWRRSTRVSRRSRSLSRGEVGRRCYGLRLIDRWANIQMCRFRGGWRLKPGGKVAIDSHGRIEAASLRSVAAPRGATARPPVSGCLRGARDWLVVVLTARSNVSSGA